MATEGEILGRKQDKEKGGFEGEGEREEQLGGGKRARTPQDSRSWSQEAMVASIE